MSTSPPESGFSNADGDTTVLVIGQEPRLSQLVSALAAQGFDVETCSVEDAVVVVHATAPDLALLVGEATLQNAALVVERFSADAAGAVVPLVLLSEISTGALNLAFKLGIVGRVDPNLNVDAIARRVREIARELPERPGQTDGSLGEATLDQLVGLLSRELRSGVLSITEKEHGEEEYGARIVLRTGRAITEGTEAFLRRVKPLVADRPAAAFRFREHSSGRVDSVAPPRPSDIEGLSELKFRRVLIVSSDRDRAESLARALRSHEALVVVISGSEVDLERAKSLDPEVIVVNSSDFVGSCAGFMEVIRDDLRMRWASILIFPADQQLAAASDLSEIGPLANKIAKLTKPDRDLLQRAKSDASFDTRLEIIGPSRTLRALAQSSRTLRISLRHPRALIEIDVAQGSIMGASAEYGPEHPERVTGTTALAVFMALGSGKLHVEESPGSELFNLVSPVDLTLSIAAAEALPMVPSILPPPLILTPTGLLADSATPAVKEPAPLAPATPPVRPQESAEKAADLPAKSAIAEGPQSEKKDARGDWWLGGAVRTTGSLPPPGAAAEPPPSIYEQKTENIEVVEEVSEAPSEPKGQAPPPPEEAPRHVTPLQLDITEEPSIPGRIVVPEEREVQEPAIVPAPEPKAERPRLLTPSRVMVAALLAGLLFITAAVLWAWLRSIPQDQGRAKVVGDSWAVLVSKQPCHRERLTRELLHSA